MGNNIDINNFQDEEENKYADDVDAINTAVKPKVRKPPQRKDNSKKVSNIGMDNI